MIFWSGLVTLTIWIEGAILVYSQSRGEDACLRDSFGMHGERGNYGRRLMLEESHLLQEGKFVNGSIWIMLKIS